jgi:hypothetical protein
VLETRHSHWITRWSRCAREISPLVENRGKKMNPIKEQMTQIRLHQFRQLEFWRDAKIRRKLELVF